MNAPLFDVRSLAIDFPTDEGLLHALRGVSLRVEPGEILGIVGESGCGKSTLAYAMLGDPGAKAVVRGEALLRGQDILQLSASALRSIQGRRIAMVPQNPGAALNPARRIGDQLREVLAVHAGLTGPDAHDRIAALLEKVHLPDPSGLLRRWPHELSGGQQQRLVIAMALLGGPDLLVLDEPTTGLDVTVEAAVLDLLAELRLDLDVTVVIISHNLGVIARACDRVIVMYAGLVVETGPVAALFATPRHPYTRALLDCVPRIDRPPGRQPPPPIPGSLPDPLGPLDACSFANRCAHVRPACRSALPPLLPVSAGHETACFRWDELAMDGLPAEAGEPGTADGGGRDLLRIEGLRVSYAVGRSKGRRVVLRAVDDVALDIASGRVTAIVGESGSGKSSLAAAIAGLRAADAGTIHLDGKPVARSLRRRPGWTRRFLQMVFQDHTSTLNPELRAGNAIGRTVRLLDGKRGRSLQARVAELVAAVGLDPGAALRRPGDLSGGQRQRIAIARAFAGRPNVVICDEITSALDVSVQAQVLAFLRGLQRANGTSLLFITHDLGVVRQIADTVVVMYLGTICERGSADAVFAGPNHPYTEALLSAVAVPDPTARYERIRLTGALPDPLDRRIGCPFKTRCPRKQGVLCDDVEPPWRTIGSGHVIRCHIPAEELVAAATSRSAPAEAEGADPRLTYASGA